MGTWFRDYVYFPLGGSRVRTRMRLVANLFVVWFLTGLWHGANWTFICWGLMFFVLIVIDKLLWARIFREGFLFSAVSRLWTLFFVICGWVLFRADSLDSAWSYLRVMFHVGGLPLADAVTILLLKENAVLLVVSLLSSLPLAPILRSFADRVFASPGASVLRAIVRTLWILALFVASLSFVAKGAHNPFLYFNF
jgi:alginate O-acetyltransferase complex protein AlgI